VLGRDDEAEEAAARYRYLVKLVEDLARKQPARPEGKRDVRAVRNYARWARISLRMLADDGTVPPIHGGSAQFPVLGLAEDMPAWLPHPLPPGWVDEADDDPSDPAEDPDNARSAREPPARGG
jgi:hypothetical protein